MLILSKGNLRSDAPKASLPPMTHKNVTALFFAILVYNMANQKRRTLRKANKRRTQQRSQKRRTLRGGSDLNLPIRAFYPQNTFEHDMSRQMTTSVLKGGSRRNHSRRYLKPISGGSGFFADYGTTYGTQNVSNQITGSNLISSGLSLGPTYKV